MDIRLDGRTALITGGSRGLGRATALRLAESGARVAIVARRPDVVEETVEELKKVACDKVVGFSLDVCDPSQFAPTHQAVVDVLGPVDILVNNAGTHAAGPFLETTDEAWQADLDLKLFSAIRMNRLVLPGMKERGWGRVVNTVATLGKTPPANTSPTSISRAAGMALTKVLANEFGSYGITVNAIAVGEIDSDQVDQMMTSQPEVLEKIRKRIPAGRLGESQEFGDLACFLVSEKAGFINGVALNVDGGMCPVL